jgi:hypothetical protein
MKYKISTLFVLGLVIAFNAIAISQDKPSAEKWNQDPRMTAIYPTGQYVQLPQQLIHEDPVPKVARVYNTNIGTMLVNPNFRIHPNPGTTQSEVIITRHPLNQAIMFGSANTVWPPSGFSGISEGVYVTTNSGVNWFGSDSVTSPVLSGHGGDPGPTIDKNGVFIISHLGYPTNGMFANYSTNNGTNWSATYTIIGGSQDKNFSGTDDAPSSAYYGRSYTVWSLFTASLPPIDISYTTNGGVSWSSPAQINVPPSAHYSQGCDIRCGPNGEVYVTWAAPVTGSPWTEDFYGFAKSTNGGVTWTVTENIFDGNGIRGNLTAKNSIRVNSFPRIDVDRSGGARNGWIYIVGCDKNLAPSGSDPDIILHRSTDGGTTWSAGIRVNQDPINNGKTQYFPAIRVDEFGGINIVYYDDRNVAANQCEVYVSRSIDGGTTWTDILVSDHNFTPNSIPGLAGGYQGDYIGITSGNNKIWPLWCDNSWNSQYQAWTTSIDLGPAINHTPLPNTENLAGPYVVNCVIIPAGSAIDPTKTKLMWSRNNVNITDSVTMTNSSGNNWTGNIPGNGTAATYRYYIKTADMLNRVATHPAGAPAILNLFLAQPDVTPPVVTTVQLPNLPKTNWPCNLTATATDNIGLDSVWIRWYKNTPSTGIKHKKMTNTGGNNFAGIFNSDTTQVAYNDSIFYRVFAVDNSANHNRDSTALYHFKIIAIAYGCIGTGSSTVAYPFNTYWHDSRTQMLYTSSEIIAGGGAPGSISKLAFNVSTADNLTMNGFNIRMQNTSMTSLSTFVTTGWTTVYTGTYTVPGSGWQSIDLQTPFAWSSGSNLLIEICFDNTSYTLATNVFASTAAGMTVEQHADNSTGCSFASPTVQSLRPNICMTINLLTGSQMGQLELPKTFALAQNYPNPFNPTTSIKYSVPKQSLVKLVVYDLIGREVATLVNGMKQPGNYEVNFDASNLASGAYFYRIEAGDFKDVKKMVLLK